MADIPLKTFRRLFEWGKTLEDIERCFHVWKEIMRESNSNDTYTKLRDWFNPIPLLELLSWQTPDIILTAVVPILTRLPDIDLDSFFVAGFGMDDIQILLKKDVEWEDVLILMKKGISMEDMESKTLGIINFERIFKSFGNVKNIYEKVIPFLQQGMNIDDIYMLLKTRDITLEKLHTNLLPVLKRLCYEDKKKTTRFILEELISHRITIEQAIQYVDVVCNKKRKCSTIIEISNKKR